MFWTPFLVMAGFGWGWLAAEKPRWLWLTYALPLLHVVVISGRAWDWQAGNTISARYLVPIIPLLPLPWACSGGRSWAVRWRRCRWLTGKADRAGVLAITKGAKGVEE